MNTIKELFQGVKTFALVLLGAGTLALAETIASAQQYQPVSLGTNFVKSGTTSNYTGSTFSLVRSRIATIQPFVQLASNPANQSNITFTVDASVDGSHWHTNWATFSLLSAGYAGSTICTNYDFGGNLFGRIGSIAGGASVDITNVTVAVGTKPGL